MTGNEIKAMREALGLSQSKLGQVLCLVDPGICRWEARGDDEVETDNFRDQLTHMLEHAVDSRRSAEERAELGAKLFKTVNQRGMMFGVHLILKEYYEEVRI